MSEPQVEYIPEHQEQPKARDGAEQVIDDRGCIFDTHRNNDYQNKDFYLQGDQVWHAVLDLLPGLAIPSNELMIYLCRSGTLHGECPSCCERYIMDNVSKMVLTMNKQEVYNIAFFDGQIFVGIDGYEAVDVTHWCKFPQAPC